MSEITGEHKKLAEDILGKEVYDWHELPGWLHDLVNDLIEYGWKKP